MTTKTANKNLTSFIKSLDPKLTAAQMCARAKAAGYKPERGSKKPLAEWLSSRVSSIRYTLGIKSGQPAAPAPASAALTPERVRAVKSFALSPAGGEEAFRQTVRRIGTDRARVLLDQIEGEP
jgi:hypothetical protein